jgi:hypothetical protein
MLKGFSEQLDRLFGSVPAEMQLSPSAVRELWDDGFAVIPGPVPTERLAELASFYDQAVLQADANDIKVERETTRVSDFVNRNPEFDDLYLHPPILEACCLVIEQPFKLSTMHARTLRARTSAQTLHVDFASDAQGWPMVGFIYMVDEFRPDNGATLFIAGSQGAENLPGTFNLVPACGPAG